MFTYRFSFIKMIRRHCLNLQYRFEVSIRLVVFFYRILLFYLEESRVQIFVFYILPTGVLKTMLNFCSPDFFSIFL